MRRDAYLTGLHRRVKVPDKLCTAATSQEAECEFPRGAWGTATKANSIPLKKLNTFLNAIFVLHFT